MNGRGQYGTSGHVNGQQRGSYGRVTVGLKIFHTPGDSDRAVRQIDTEMNAIVDAVYRAMGADPSLRRKYTLDEAAKLSSEERDAWKAAVLASKNQAVQSPLWSFFESAISPAYDEWMKFRGEHEFYNLFTSWEEYENWLARARQLRETATAKGVRLETPDPVDLSKTLPGAILETAGGAAKKAGEAALDVFKIAKWGAIGALAIGGIFALTSLVSTVRKGREPASYYTGLYRGLRRGNE